MRLCMLFKTVSGPLHLLLANYAAVPHNFGHHCGEPIFLLVHARVHVVQRALEMLLEAGSVVEHLAALVALELAPVFPSLLSNS